MTPKFDLGVSTVLAQAPRGIAAKAVDRTRRLHQFQLSSAFGGSPHPGAALRAPPTLPLQGRVIASAFRGEPGGAARLSEFAHAQNVTLPLGHRDDAARV